MYHRKESQGVSSEDKIFLYSFMLVCIICRLSCNKVEVPISTCSTLGASSEFCYWQNSSADDSDVFVWNCAPHWKGFFFSYTCLGSNSVFFHCFHPFWCEIHEQGQTPDTWRPLIHARLRKIQSALASFGRLAVQTTLAHCPSLNYQMTQESSNWILANPSPVLFDLSSSGTLVCEHWACRVLGMGCGRMLRRFDYHTYSQYLPIQNPSIQLRSPEPAVSKSGVKTSSPSSVTQAQVKVIHLPVKGTPPTSQGLPPPQAILLRPDT